MRLTKRSVESLEARSARYAVFDEDIKGFGVRVAQSGEKSFYFVYRAGKGRAATKRWLRIGTFPSMTVEQAREIAKENYAEVVRGNDPAEDVKNGKLALSVAQAFVQFFAEHGPKLKHNTLRTYTQMERDHIRPHMGSLKITAVQVRHIAELHHSMRTTPYQANRCVALLSKYFHWCEKNGYRARGDNPVSGIEKYQEQKRQTFMGPQELAALGKAFSLLESGNMRDESGKVISLDPTISTAIKVLMLTGARCMEILTLKWEYIDWQKGIANLPDSKTGAKTIHLPHPALALLKSLPRINEYCFTGRFGKGHIVNIKDSWARLLKAAGLSGWRIHDLRHAYASYAACSGKSLPIIGAILGHTQASTTSRYAHLADNPVACAAEETSIQILKDFTGGEVMTFTKTAG